MIGLSTAGVGGLTGLSTTGAGGLTGLSTTGAGGLTGLSTTCAGGLTGLSTTGAGGLTGLNKGLATATTTQSTPKLPGSTIGKDAKILICVRLNFVTQEVACL